MKRTFICIIAAIAMFGINGASAQEKKDKIQNDKIMFYSMKLDLTPEEAQAFWPLYNQYSKEVWKTHGKAIKALKKLHKNSSSLSEAETDLLVETFISSLELEASLQRKYYEEFKKILPLKKAAQIFVVEDEFRITLLRKFSDEKKGGKDSGHKKQKDNAPSVE